MVLADYAQRGVSTNFADPFGRRLLRLLDRFRGRLAIGSGYRSKAQQQKLYDDWVESGYRVPSVVARPGTSKHERDPAEAADLDITDPDLTWDEVHEAAAELGLWFPIVREDWHAEAMPEWTDSDPEPEPEPAPPATSEEDDMIGIIHQPTQRPGAPAVVDFTWLPEDGRTFAGRACSCTLIVRRGTGDPQAQVWFDGNEHTVDLPTDGRPALISVERPGLCSVVGAGLVVEAREFWA